MAAVLALAGCSTEAVQPEAGGQESSSLPPVDPTAPAGLVGSADDPGSDSRAPRESAPSAHVPTDGSSTDPSDVPHLPPTVAAAPVAVTVPSIELTAELIPLGLQPDGTLEVPVGGEEVGWFTGGSRVGEPGPTVIAAHVDDRDGPGAFAALPEVQVGDEVLVHTDTAFRTTSEADAARYVVVAANDYGKDGFPTAAVFGATQQDELRLITCTGEWDADRGSYPENRVVFAVRTP